MLVRVLAAGDLHIGLRPTRVPDDVAGVASAARMWDLIVHKALDQRVDAVLLSGDVVDHANRFYEATGPLERGLAALATAGIDTFAVAGNHDHDVFPRIAMQLNSPRFHFLGRGGRWEEAHLRRDGKPLLRILGWSFPQRYHRESPLVDFPAAADLDVPTIGLLHADVDAPASPYAPVSRAELESRQVALWVLGHVHKPQLWTSPGGAQVLYPGSPQALAPDESGSHGPWLIELDGAAPPVCKQLEMSQVRYETAEVDLTGAEHPEEFETRIHQTFRSCLEEAAGGAHRPAWLSLRLHLTGHTALCGKMVELIGKLPELQLPLGDTTAGVEKIVNLTQPAIDLEELALRKDPTAALARTLLALERGEVNESVRALLGQAAGVIRQVRTSPAYASSSSGDDQEAPPEDQAHVMLLEQGRKLLETLRAQTPQAQEEIA